jgi:hypothetical protein
MAQNLELLELLNTLINAIEDNTMILNKETLQLVITCLQVMQAKVRLLQSLSQLLNDEIMDLKKKQPVKCSELVFFRTILSMMMMMIFFIISQRRRKLVRKIQMHMKMNLFMNLHFKSFLLILVKKTFQCCNNIQ